MGQILKITGIELDLISDIDMHLFVEKGMRGGISYIPNRNNKENNKNMRSYDDANNLGLGNESTFTLWQI